MLNSNTPAGEMSVRGSGKRGRCFSNRSISLFLSLTKRPDRVLAVSPLSGLPGTQGRRCTSRCEGGLWGLPWDAGQGIPSAGYTGSLGSAAPSVLICCTLKTVSQLERKKKKSVAFFRLRNSNIPAFLPPANFRSPSILWEENGVKIKHSIQK